MTARRRILLALALLLIAGAVVFFGALPAVVEAKRNGVAAPAAFDAGEKARALHRTLLIADLHADTLLWRRNVLDRGRRGHVDLPRLRDGNVALQVFSSVTKTPRGMNYDANDADSDQITLLVLAQLQPVRTWRSLLERSLWHAEKMHHAVASSSGRLRLVLEPGDVDALVTARAGGADVVGALLSIEGLHVLEHGTGDLARLHAAGFRMAGLAHFFDNPVAGSIHGLHKGGLTAMGRDVVAEMERIGMIIDVAHVSHRTLADVVSIARRPIVSSHGGVQAVCPGNRNLTDDEIRGIARTGGIVGIGYWEGAICSTSPTAIARSIAYVRDLVGIEHVGLGSDFDGAVTVPFDTGQLALVTQALLDAGFSADDIAKVMGGNAMRLLRDGIAPLPPTTTVPSAARS